MLVSDLSTETDSFKEEKHTTFLRDVRLGEEGIFLRDEEGYFEFDEVALNHVAKHLRINPAYLSKCPPSLQRDNVNYWLDHYGDTEVNFYTVGGELKGVYDVNKKIFPVERVLELATRLFAPTDEVKALNTAEDLVHLDVVSLTNSVEVPGLGTEERPRVGDITHGGLRMFIYPFQEKAPEVESYFNRVWCTNGMSSPKLEHKITLKGHTVDDVLAELEDKARELIDELPEMLNQYKETAQIPVPNKVGEFVYQVGREAKLPSRIIDRVMTGIATLPDQPMVYDVMQLFTSVANEPVTWANRLRLQRLGGEFALNTHKILHRCGQCERPI